MFQLDLRSGTSVYQQVIRNIKELIVTDALPEGTRLPSVRDLSRQLTINPNTVQKAFKELERDGYIYTVSGRGTFVSPSRDIHVDDAMIASSVEEVMGSFRELLNLGIDPARAKDVVCKAMDEVIDSRGRTK